MTARTRFTRAALLAGGVFAAAWPALAAEVTPERLLNPDKVRRRKGGTYPLSHLYGHFGLVRLSRLGHDVPWVKA